MIEEYNFKNDKFDLNFSIIKIEIESEEWNFVEFQSIQFFQNWLDYLKEYCQLTDTPQARKIYNPNKKDVKNFFANPKNQKHSFYILFDKNNEPGISTIPFALENGKFSGADCKQLKRSD